MREAMYMAALALIVVGFLVFPHAPTTPVGPVVEAIALPPHTPVISHVYAWTFYGDNEERVGTLEVGPPMKFHGNARKSARVFFRAMAATQQDVCGEKHE